MSTRRAVNWPQENDILFAHKAINIASGLSNGARRVAGALVDHFNKKTGQCDPSISRLAALLGINRATVLRATKELSGPDAGLFKRTSHGGHSHRTMYQPVWERFRRIVEEWEAGMKGQKASSKPADSQLQRSQDCDVDGRKTATLKVAKLRHKPIEVTNRINQSKDPGGKPPPELAATSRSSGVGDRQTGRPRNGLGKRTKPPDAQRFMIHGINGGKSIARDDAAKAQAARRWQDQLLKKHHARYEQLVPQITTKISDAATAAEM
ncbi:MAG: helix-turn-helix domain-containing protein, partial [Alphaproteobacteria bacterium]